MSGPLSITLFVVAIVVAIMLHELGHFLTARRFGMRADRFFLGFGPTLVSRRIGETEYGVKALPLGGFVRIVGMSPEDSRQPPVLDVLFDDPAAPAFDADRLDQELATRGVAARTRAHIGRRVTAAISGLETGDALRARVREVLATELTDTGRVGDTYHRVMRGDDGRFFHDRPAWQRAVVLASGSAAHFVIAVGLLVGAYAALPQWTGELDTRVAVVEPGSPAEMAGLVVGDRVLAVGEVRSASYDELREAIRERPGQPTPVTVQRDGDELMLRMVPRPVEDPATGGTVGVVGFAPDLQTVRMDPIEAVEHALFGQPQPGNPGGFVPMFTGSIRSIGAVFSPSGIGDIFAQATGQQPRSMDGAVSLVGAASIAGQVGDTGVVGLMMFIGLLAVVNVFIGIFNLAPLPPLDGGHLAALGIERGVNAVRQVRGKAADFVLDPRLVGAVAVPVLAALSVIVLALLWMDITNPIRLG